MEGEGIDSFDELKSMFKGRLQGEEEEALESDLQKCQQAPDELLVDYAQRFKVLAIRFYGDCMQVRLVQMTIMCQFLSGLNGDIQRWVCSKNPRNFDEAFVEGRKEENNVRLSKRKERNSGAEGYDKVPRHIKDTIERMELVARRAG